MSNATTIGLDAGNDRVKLVGPHGTDTFYSALGPYRERKLQSTHGDDDMIFEYAGRRGFAGTLALIEAKYGGSLGGDTKAHDDAKIRVLLGLHRYATRHGIRDFNLIVGQPVSRHTEREKTAIKRMLAGNNHEITVNGRTLTLIVHRVEVAAEGGAAFWSAPERGLLRIIDVGSATINCVTMLDGRYVDRDSFTLNYGYDPDEPAELMRAIEIAALNHRWAKSDQVRLVGGAASELIEPVQATFGRAQILQPKHGEGALFANAVGFYEIGRRLYGR